MTSANDNFPDINIPSILGLPAPPETVEEVVEYIRVLHNLLGVQQARLARALTILSYYRTGQTTEAEKDNMDAVGSGALMVQIDTGEIFFDRRLTLDDPVPEWLPVGGSGGGAFLPLAAGKDYPLTGDLHLTLATTEPPDVNLANGEAVFWYEVA